MPPILSFVIQPLIQHLHHLYEILSATSIPSILKVRLVALLTDYMSFGQSRSAVHPKAVTGRSKLHPELWLGC
jgi:hypothetical protein